MKKWLLTLNNEYQCALLSFICVLLICLIGGPFAIIFLRYDLISGFLLGGLIGCFFYWLLGLLAKKEQNSGKTTYSVIVFIARYLIIALISIISAYFFYKKDIQLFNVVTLLMGYLVSTIIYAIIMVKERTKA